jgi:ATP-dependent exoDNAse (exonuclease V) beta subunit
MRLRDLPVLDVSKLKAAPPGQMVEGRNLQNVAAFKAENDLIESASVPVKWRRPSDSDADRAPAVEMMPGEDETPEMERPAGAGRLRGVVLHKIMEEVLTGELVQEQSSIGKRARELLSQLKLDSRGQAPEAEEIAGTAWRTLNLPDVAALRPRLLAEIPVYCLLETGPQGSGLAGRIDAVAIDDGRPDVVLDWKSDVAPSTEDIRTHAAQLQEYLEVTGSGRGALVYMTTGVVHWVRHLVLNEAPVPSGPPRHGEFLA